MTSDVLKGSMPFAAAVAALLLGPLSGGCGAKTGLLIPDAEVREDADVDPDVEPDEDVCIPEIVQIDRRRSQILFVIDRSSSMLWSIDESFPEPGEPTRWELLRNALDTSLFMVEDFTELGAKFFPAFLPYDPVAYACENSAGVDVAVGLGTRAAVMQVFVDTYPTGGTPTALALAEARDSFLANPRPGIDRYIILATDGGPNCRELAPVPPSSCICTGPAEVYCVDPLIDYVNCLDAERTLSIIDDAFGEHGIPVYVVGIEDPSRTDLTDFLDDMAVAGGRPRPEPSERRFYSARREGELEEAFETILEATARCVFSVRRTTLMDDRLEISIDDEFVPRDPDRVDGWDWTDVETGQLTFFGHACELAGEQGARVQGVIPCP
jgi:hypothetical protein